MLGAYVFFVLGLVGVATGLIALLMSGRDRGGRSQRDRRFRRRPAKARPRSHS